MKKAIVLVVLVAGLAGGWYWWTRKKVAPKEDPATALIETKVERGDLRVVVASTGRVVANLDVEIKCKASGEIVTLNHDISDTVKRGDLLVELDPVDELRRVKQSEVSTSSSLARLEQARLNLEVAKRNLETERRRAEAALKSAEARAKDTRAKADRLRELFEGKLTSQEELDTAETTAVQARADLESARARVEDLQTQQVALDIRRQDVELAQAQVETNHIELSLAQQRLRDTRVFAPIDGVVSARNVQIGQIISSGISNVGGGTTMLTLSDLSRLFVLASVDESDIGKIQLGQPVNITVDAFPMQIFSGRVVRIATRGVSVSNVVTFEVKIEILGPSKRLLKPEMTANVEVVVAEKTDVLLIPMEAALRREGRRVVTVALGEGKTEERTVELGINDGLRQEVVSGVEAGETIAYRRGEADSRWRAGGARTGAMSPGQMRMMMGGGQRPR